VLKFKNYSYLILFLGILIVVGGHGFARYAYSLLLPSMKESLKLNYTEMGLLGTANLIGYVSFTLIVGYLATKFSQQRVIWVNLWVLNMAMIATGFADSFLSAFTFRLFTGLSYSCIYITNLAYVVSWFDAGSRGRVMGLVSSGTGVGILLSAVFIPTVLGVFGGDGWRYSWYFMGLSGIFVTVFVMIFYKEPPSFKKEGAAVKNINSLLVFKIFKIWLLGFSFFFFGIGYIIYFTFLPAYFVKEIGVSSNLVSLAWSINGFVSIFAGFFWGFLSDKIGRKNGLVLNYMLIILSVVVVTFWQSSSALIVSIILFGASFLGIPTIISASSADSVEVELIPQALGMITFLFGIGQAVGPTIGGYIADKTGSFKPAMLAAAIFLIFGLLVSIVRKGDVQKTL